jgi:hypothetical protein
LYDDVNDLITDLYESYRHQIPDIKYFSLFEKNVYEIITGKRAKSENYPLLPMMFKYGDSIVVLQYRILTEHIEDWDGLIWNEILEPYEVWEIDGEAFTSGKKRFRIRTDISINSVLQQIPGLDGRGASIENFKTSDGHNCYGVNFAYYHHSFGAGVDANNISYRYNGWNDPNLFVAHTKNDRILNNTSYLIPLELILRTPLETWNPYNVERKDIVNGSGTSDDPYDGYNEHGKYFLTPAKFFTGEIETNIVADTHKYAYVQTPNDGTKLLYASGIWITLPTIKDVGTIRIRYPIYRESVEDGIVGKYLNLILLKQLYIDAVNKQTLLHLEDEIQKLKYKPNQ